MARIIPLNRDVEPPGDDATGLQGCAGEPAQIIFFPGVRYERWAEENEHTPSIHHGDGDEEPLARDWLEV